MKTKSLRMIWALLLVGLVPIPLWAEDKELTVAQADSRRLMCDFFRPTGSYPFFERVNECLGQDAQGLRPEPPGQEIKSG